jgi:hypothetical protein
MGKKFKALFLIFLFFFLIQFSLAQQNVVTVGDALKRIKIGGALELLFGLRPDQPIEVAIIWLILFIMLFFAFSDIFSIFTAFSRTTAYILGFGLALITAMTRLIFLAAVWLFGITGGLGALGVAIILITALVAAVGVHLASTKLVRWATRRQIAIEAIKAAKSPAKAWKKLQEFEELTKKK